MVAASPLIVIWHNRNEGHRCRWSLRYILPDGQFFGEATFYDERRSANLQGALSADDTAEVWRLAGAIREAASANAGTHDTVASAWDALLAEGAYSHPSVIYRYRAEEEKCISLAEHFRALTALLRPYVEAASGA